MVLKEFKFTEVRNFCKEKDSLANNVLPITSLVSLVLADAE